MNFSNLTRKVAVFSASSKATIVSIISILIWLVTGPFFHYSDTWQLIANTSTSLITFVMVFVLNNAQARDTAAINAKLDALILANKEVDNKLVSIEDATDADLKDARALMQDAVKTEAEY